VLLKEQTNVEEITYFFKRARLSVKKDNKSWVGLKFFLFTGALTCSLMTMHLTTLGVFANACSTNVIRLLIINQV
jgi:hypothetical protein